MTKADLNKRPEQVSSMFDRVSKKYDETNDILSMGNAARWRVQTRHAIAPQPGEKILDVAAGTGTVSKVLADAGAKVTALDFSAGMIEEGKRIHGANPNIDFVQGDATKLPFDDNTFDASTVSFGLRNVQQPKIALQEMLRVTKPGGRLVIAEFSTPPQALIRTGYRAYMQIAMPTIVKLVSSDPEAYTYLNESIIAWPAQRELASWLREAGFERVKYRNLTAGVVALHKGFVPLADSGSVPS
ncbi:class I SAM-dependent methyltransferase [Pseudoclavibacter sp. 8L]|uniref:class I SAM-dependent methyltransferase n=1 Tax=Pseudoclavibacter sp. 8L TaxID=2653162 RepID=UPI0012F2698F|nr:class I SAM-dependent methyltransferase [Pseudoclavibacter sp. 8L]VXB62413.1 Demethylmenaquinone methyltransferase [Pseudoclavibacter sp. 8L]